MSAHVDGTGTCDRCGKNLPNTGVQHCVTLSGMDEAGQPVHLHVCTTQPDPCARRVLTTAALRHLHDQTGAIPDWHSEAPPETSPDPEESTT